MPKRAHERHRHHKATSEEGFISERTRNFMNNKEKLMMGILAGGILAFLVLSILILFGRGKDQPADSVPAFDPKIEEARKRITTPYPTIPPIQDMTIMVSERRFNPQSFAIPRGGLVVFLNVGASPITIEPVDSKSEVLNSIGTLTLGQPKEIRMTEPGTYKYRNKENPDQVGEFTIQ